VEVKLPDSVRTRIVVEFAVAKITFPRASDVFVCKTSAPSATVSGVKNVILSAPHPDRPLLSKFMISSPQSRIVHSKALEIGSHAPEAPHVYVLSKPRYPSSHEAEHGVP
jgi:hypothetical protein